MSSVLMLASLWKAKQTWILNSLTPLDVQPQKCHENITHGSTKEQRRQLCKWCSPNRLTYVQFLCRDFSVPSKCGIVWFDSCDFFFIKHYCSSSTFMIFRSAQKKLKQRYMAFSEKSSLLCFLKHAFFKRLMHFFWSDCPRCMPQKAEVLNMLPILKSLANQFFNFIGTQSTCHPVTGNIKSKDLWHIHSLV